MALALKLHPLHESITETRPIKMPTLTKTYTEQTGTMTTKLQAIRIKYNKLMKELDFSYFAFISFVIAFSACLGGGLVKFSLQYNSAYWQFSLGMCLSLVNIVACVAQFPVKWVFNIFVVTTLANVVLILVSVFL
jgi:hypothetical protein